MWLNGSIINFPCVWNFKYAVKKSPVIHETFICNVTFSTAI